MPELPTDSDTPNRPYGISALPAMRLMLAHVTRDDATFRELCTEDAYEELVVGLLDIATDLLGQGHKGDWDAVAYTLAAAVTAQTDLDMLLSLDASELSRAFADE